MKPPDYSSISPIEPLEEGAFKIARAIAETIEAYLSKSMGLEE
jgi:hypothetical protein